MEIKLSSVQLLVNYMNKLYVILNWSTVDFILETRSNTNESYLTDQVKGHVFCGISLVWRVIWTSSDQVLYTICGYSLDHFLL